MKTVILSLALLTAVSSAGAASTQPGRLTDSQYIQLARCAGLAQGLNQDGTALNNALRQAHRNREGVTRDLADEAKRNGVNEARRANSVSRAALETEFSGRCTALAG